MATIRASCPDCGDVELTTQDMQVRVCADDQRGSYNFRCPACLLAVTSSAEPRIVDLLVSRGVELEVWSLPLELREPHPAGEPFSHDDLLDFRLELSDGKLSSDGFTRYDLILKWEREFPPKATSQVS